MSMPSPSTIKHLFFQLSRLLLVDNPIYAQLLAALPKAARPDLNGVLALGWDNELPLLYYHPKLIFLLADDSTFVLSLLQEELLHYLLNHPARQADFQEDWAFHLACDLDVLQYLPDSVITEGQQKLIARLQLPQPWQLRPLYDRLLELEKAYSRDQLYRWLNCSSISRQTHVYWPRQWNVSQQFLWQNYHSRQVQLLHQLFPASELLRQLDTHTQQAPKENWKVILQRFGQQGQRTILKSSHRRPSKRYGTQPGSRRLRQARLLVIIDTSGSVEDELLAGFFGQLQYLHRQQTKIDVIEADYQVRKAYPFNGQLPQSAAGGGYTDFNPALQHANEHGPYDGVLYFTDGEATQPSVNCNWPLLWLVSGEKTRKDWTGWPGRVVGME